MSFYIQPQIQQYYSPQAYINARKPVKTSILYFNDYHGNDSAMEKLKTISDTFTKTKADTQSDTLKLTGGDIMKGSNAQENAMWVDFLNSIGLDASAMGNHELDQGSQNFNNQALKANYKYVSTNTRVNPNGTLGEAIKQQKLVKSCIINKNGHAYGFVGLTPNDYKYKISGEKLNNTDITSDDTPTTLAELQTEVNRLREAGVNKIIMLSHYDDSKNQIPTKVSGIDVIISGHLHDVYKGLQNGKNLFTSPAGEPVVKVEGGRDGKFAGILDLTFDADGRVTSANNELIETAKVSPDLSVLSIKQQHEMFKSPVGTLMESVPMEGVPESPIAEKVADIIKEKSGADIALVNPGAISSSIDKGIITEAEIQKTLPYDDKIVKITMTKQELEKVLNNPEKNPIQVSGMSYTIGKDKKVKNMDFGAKNTQNELVVVLDEHMLKNLKDINYQIKEKYDWNCANATIEHLKNRHFIPLDFKTDGRIKVES